MNVELQNTSLVTTDLLLQLLSHVSLFATPGTAAYQASLSFTISWSLLKLMSIVLMMPSNHLIICCSRLLLPSIFPSIRIFSRSQFFVSGDHSIGASASASVLPMNIQDWFPLGYWFDLLAVQGTLKHLLQYHSSKASNLQHSALLYGPTLTSVHDYWKKP